MTSFIRPLAVAAMASILAVAPAYAADSNAPKVPEASRVKTDKDLPKVPEVSRPKTDAGLPKGAESTVRRTTRGR